MKASTSFTFKWQLVQGLFFLSLLMAGVLMPEKLTSQEDEQVTPFASASAGLFFGEPSGYNGPLLMARYGESFSTHFLWAARAQFRDDDRSGGRVQALGAGGELFALLPLGTSELYGVGGLVIEVVHLSGSYYRRPDMEGGVYLRPHVGVGMSIPAGATDLLLEMNYGFGSGPTYTFWSVGARSNREVHDSAGAAFHVYANQLTPFGNRYEAENDYRGYTIAVDVRHDTPLGRAVRFSLGIDFVDFSYSTGVIEFLLGAVGDIVRTDGGTFTVSWVPQVGAAVFAEGGSGPYPMGVLGLEARVAHHGVALFGGASGLLANGPDGVFPGVQIRFGASVQQ